MARLNQSVKSGKSGTILGVLVNCAQKEMAGKPKSPSVPTTPTCTNDSTIPSTSTGLIAESNDDSSTEVTHLGLPVRKVKS